MQCLTQSKALIVTDDDKDDNDAKSDVAGSSFESLGHCVPSLSSSDSVPDSRAWKGYAVK